MSFSAMPLARDHAADDAYSRILMARLVRKLDAMDGRPTPKWIVDLADTPTPVMVSGVSALAERVQGG